MSSSTPGMLDTKKTPEIYPMTSMQDTVEYFNDKLNQLSAGAYEASERLERLGKQVQQLSTRAHQPQQQPAPSQSQLQADEEIDDRISRLSHAPDPDLLSIMFRRFSELRPRAPEPQPELSQPEPDLTSLSFRRVSELRPLAPQPEPEPETQPEQSEEAQARKYSTFSVQCLAPESEHSDPESEHDISPRLWGRVLEKFKSEQDLSPVLAKCQAEAVQDPARGLKRLSLCMMPSDAMSDILPGLAGDMSVPASPVAPAAPPAHVLDFNGLLNIG